MTSLRGRLLRWLLGLLTLVGLLGGLVTYVVALGEPNEDFDNQLRQLAFYIGEGAKRSFADSPESAGLEPEDVILVQIWDEAGQPIRLSDPTIGLPRQDRTGFTDVEAHNNWWRVYTLVLPDRTVQIAQRMEIRQDQAGDKALHAVYPFLALVPLSWFVVVLSIGRVLKPLDRLATDVAARRADAIGPLPLAGLPREVVPLVEAVNALLARQQALMDFRQRFLSDAAHQMRTPLTAARLQAENLRRAGSLEDVHDLSAAMDGGLKRMSGMVAQLLDLARAEAPNRPTPHERHDLAAIAAEAIGDVLTLADRRSIDIGMTDQVLAPIRCDPREIRMLIGNLLDNAVRYTREGGAVDVSVAVADAQALLSVADTGPGIPAADLPRLFGRFVRLGEADIEGSGLGLAIVKAIATRHDAAVQVQNRTDRTGLRVTVAFPLA